MPTYRVVTKSGEKGPYSLRVVLRGIETGKIPPTATLIESESRNQVSASEIWFSSLQGRGEPAHERAPDRSSHQRAAAAEAPPGRTAPASGSVSPPPTDVQLIEQTRKRWKLLILVGYILMSFAIFAGILIVLLVPVERITAALVLALAIWLMGFGMHVYARVMAWWHHG